MLFFVAPFFGLVAVCRGALLDCADDKERSFGLGGTFLSGGGAFLGGGALCSWRAQRGDAFKAGA